MSTDASEAVFDSTDDDDDDDADDDDGASSVDSEAMRLCMFGDAAKCFEMGDDLQYPVATEDDLTKPVDTKYQLFLARYGSDTSMKRKLHEAKWNKDSATARTITFDRVTGGMSLLKKETPTTVAAGVHPIAETHTADTPIAPVVLTAPAVVPVSTTSGDASLVAGESAIGGSGEDPDGFSAAWIPMQPVRIPACTSEGLPDGWQKELRERHGGKSRGHIDVYWVAPTGRSYRTIAAARKAATTPRS